MDIQSGFLRKLSTVDERKIWDTIHLAQIFSWKFRKLSCQMKILFPSFQTCSLKKVYVHEHGAMMAQEDNKMVGNEKVE